MRDDSEEPRCRIWRSEHPSCSGVWLGVAQRLLSSLALPKYKGRKMSIIQRMMAY